MAIETFPYLELAHSNDAPRTFKAEDAADGKDGVVRVLIMAVGHPSSKHGATSEPT